MRAIFLDEAGLEGYEVPGIEGYYSLAVETGDGLFQIDMRRMPEAASHTMPPEPARAATREEAALLVSRMFIACLAAKRTSNIERATSNIEGR